MLWTLQKLGVVDEAMTAKITATASPVVRNWAAPSSAPSAPPPTSRSERAERRRP